MASPFLFSALSTPATFNTSTAPSGSNSSSSISVLSSLLQNPKDPKIKPAARKTLFGAGGNPSSSMALTAANSSSSSGNGTPSTSLSLSIANLSQMNLLSTHKIEEQNKMLDNRSIQNFIELYRLCTSIAASTDATSSSSSSNSSSSAGSSSSLSKPAPLTADNKNRILYLLDGLSADVSKWVSPDDDLKDVCGKFQMALFSQRFKLLSQATNSGFVAMSQLPDPVNLSATLSKADKVDKVGKSPNVSNTSNVPVAVLGKRKSVTIEEADEEDEKSSGPAESLPAPAKPVNGSRKLAKTTSGAAKSTGGSLEQLSAATNVDFDANLKSAIELLKLSGGLEKVVKAARVRAPRQRGNRSKVSTPPVDVAGSLLFTVDGNSNLSRESKNKADFDKNSDVNKNSDSDNVNKNSETNCRVEFKSLSSVKIIPNGLLFIPYERSTSKKELVTANSDLFTYVPLVTTNKTGRVVGRIPPLTLKIKARIFLMADEGVASCLPLACDWTAQSAASFSEKKRGAVDMMMQLHTLPLAPSDKVGKSSTGETSGIELLSPVDRTYFRNYLNPLQRILGVTRQCKSRAEENTQLKTFVAFIQNQVLTINQKMIDDEFDQDQLDELRDEDADLPALVPHSGQSSTALGLSTSDAIEVS